MTLIPTFDMMVFMKCSLIPPFNQSRPGLTDSILVFFVMVKDKRAVCAVIANCGANSWSNESQVVKSWWRSFFDSHARVIFPEHYMTQAKHFYFKVRRYCQQHLQLANTNIFVTGHSLGGALAALLPTYYGFPILLRDKKFSRKKLCSFLESKKIETRSIMGGTLPDQPAFNNKKHRISGNLNTSRLIKNNAFFIGIHAALGKKDFDRIFDAFRQFFSN